MAIPIHSDDAAVRLGRAWTLVAVLHRALRDRPGSHRETDRAVATFVAALRRAGRLRGAPRLACADVPALPPQRALLDGAFCAAARVALEGRAAAASRREREVWARLALRLQRAARRIAARLPTPQPPDARQLALGAAA